MSENACIYNNFKFFQNFFFLGPWSQVIAKNPCFPINGRRKIVFFLTKFSIFNLKKSSIIGWKRDLAKLGCLWQIGDLDTKFGLRDVLKYCWRSVWQKNSSFFLFLSLIFIPNCFLHCYWAWYFWFKHKLWAICCIWAKLDLFIMCILSKSLDLALAG